MEMYASGTLKYANSRGYQSDGAEDLTTKSPKKYQPSAMHTSLFYKVFYILKFEIELF